MAQILTQQKFEKVFAGTSVDCRVWAERILCYTHSRTESQASFDAWVKKSSADKLRRSLARTWIGKLD